MKIEYTLKQMERMPTIGQGHTDDLKVETDDTRIWLSRMTIEDGMPYNNEVTIEKLQDGKWLAVRSYEAK